MKKGSIPGFLILLSAGLILSSCGAALTTITLEKRLPAKHQVDLKNGSLVVFSTVKNGEDSIVNVKISEAIAESLERRLSLEPGSVGVFNHFPGDSGKYDPDYIRELAVKANADKIFILKSVWANEPVVVKNEGGDGRYGDVYAIMAVSTQMSVYDGITARELAGIVSKDSIILSQLVSRSDLRRARLMTLFYQALVDSADEIGESVTGNFFDSWEPIERYLYYFNDSDWKNALVFANSFRWSEASRIWMEKSASNDPLTAACAAYNLALVCELSGDNGLAVKWLDFALKRYPLSTIAGYRTYLLRQLETERES